MDTPFLMMSTQTKRLTGELIQKFSMLNTSGDVLPSLSAYPGEEVPTGDVQRHKKWSSALFTLTERTVSVTANLVIQVIQ